MINCVLCNKKLRPLKTKNDWTSRNMHKKCWKKQNLFDTLQYFGNKIEERLKNNRIIYSKRVYIEDCLISDDEN